MNSSFGSPLLDQKRKRSQNQQVSKKRPKRPNATEGGVFQCFTIDGNDVNLHRRSAFTSERKKEVKGIRQKGACLRCRLLKRACSGEDPCKTCIATARAAAGSRSLWWMECIRPSFQSLNIFNQGGQLPNNTRVDGILNDLLGDDVYLDFHIPFALNVEAASAHLASWLSDDHAQSSFSVVGVFSCSTNTSLLQNALDPNLGRDLRLFVHLTTHLYTTGMQGGYQQYSDEEIRSVRDCVGNRLLLALDPLLRPSELEASEDKLGKLKSLFLLLLGTTVGMRYTCPDAIDDESDTNNDRPDPKQEALLRLLCHYLIYIGKVTSLLEPSVDEKSLADKWKCRWNKPAAFTWNSSTGLEMHYRIQPPADWIVSSSEDESMSGIDLDLSDFDDTAEFTVNADLLKCKACSTFWASLNPDGLCQSCQASITQAWFSEESMDSGITGPLASSKTRRSELDESTECDVLTILDCCFARSAQKSYDFCAVPTEVDTACALASYSSTTAFNRSLEDLSPWMGYLAACSTHPVPSSPPSLNNLGVLGVETSVEQIAHLPTVIHSDQPRANPFVFDGRESDNHSQGDGWDLHHPLQTLPHKSNEDHLIDPVTWSNINAVTDMNENSLADDGFTLHTIEGVAVRDNRMQQQASSTREIRLHKSCSRCHHYHSGVYDRTPNHEHLCERCQHFSTPRNALLPSTSEAIAQLPFPTFPFLEDVSPNEASTGPITTQLVPENLIDNAHYLAELSTYATPKENNKSVNFLCTTVTDLAVVERTWLGSVRKRICKTFAGGPHLRGKSHSRDELSPASPCDSCAGKMNAVNADQRSMAKIKLLI